MLIDNRGDYTDFGGKCKKRERYHQCALRELVEELGFNPGVEIDLYNASILRSDGQLLMFYRLPYQMLEFVPTKEIFAIEWVRVLDLLNGTKRGYSSLLRTLRSVDYKELVKALL